MRKLKQRLCSLLLCAALAVSLCVPAAAEETETYLTWNGSELVSAEVPASITEVTTGTTELNGTTTGGWYIVRSSVEISSRVTVTGNVHLILKDGCELKATEGIKVEDGNSLTIYAQSADKNTMGKLTAKATADVENAGIGGDAGNVCGDITINGGTIEARGKYNAAGIGSGAMSTGTIASSGNVTIHGGNIMASSDTGTAIGGGAGGGSITIRGGTVTAEGGQNAGSAGIGGNTVAISGGTVTTAGTGGATFGIYGISISISGGEVKATGNVAGIGGGFVGTITISGGTVTATGSDGAGIGSYGSIGSYGGGTITISGGTVTATSSNGAGIGSLEEGMGGSSSTFSTGTGGSAFIVASSIEDNGDEKKNQWSGVIFEGDSGNVYGSPTLKVDAEIPANKKLTIEEGQTLAIGEGVTLINNGTITGSGTIKGKVINNGMIEGVTVQDHTHQWDTAWSSDATNHWHKCTVTGCGERSETDAHTPGDWVIDKAATSTEAGQRHKECTVCGYTIQTETIPATGGGDGGSGGGSGGSSGGGSYTPPTYKPEVEKPGEGGGTPSISPSRPERGDTVTVTPKPDEGYEVDKITVTDKNGKPVEVTKKPDGTYTFTQPGSRVTIEVTYKAAEVPWNNPFADVSESDWYYEAVRFVQERGLMNGYDDGRFGANDALSRAQLTQILFNKEGRLGVNYLLDFSDVADEAWYAESIRWAASQGIVGGYGNGTFGPNDPITREQLAVMLWRYSGSPAAANMELNFNDESEISPFALEAMRWAVENGILNGYGGGRLGPQGQDTRAQVAQMLKNFIENQEKNT